MREFPDTALGEKHNLFLCWVESSSFGRHTEAGLAVALVGYSLLRSALHSILLLLAAVTSTSSLPHLPLSPIWLTPELSLAEAR